MARAQELAGLLRGPSSKYGVQTPYPSILFNTRRGNRPGQAIQMNGGWRKWPDPTIPLNAMLKQIQVRFV